MMGVINITPNSFSDGGLFQDKSAVLNQIEILKKSDVQYFDIGAESTAPFNEPISEELEWERLEPILISVMNSNILSPEDFLSIDTYKFSIFKKAYSLIRSKSKMQKIIWNDISGKIEDEVLDYLKVNDFDLVVSHNLCSKRNESSNHMSFVKEKIDLKGYFQSFKEKLSGLKLLDRVYFDPCFGFSKTMDQNEESLNNIESWLDKDLRWILGISRKSFLQARSLGESKAQRIKNSEDLHAEYISRWMHTFKNTQIVVRLHDPEVFNRALLLK
jgi:dihydropteroate synthase